MMAPAALRLCALLCLLGGPGAADGPPDLTGFVPVLEERFETGLSRYDGQRGVWSTLPRRGRLMTNAGETATIDGDMGPFLADLLPQVHAVTAQGLSLRTLELSPEARSAVADYITRTGQGDRAAALRYGTGRITTADTWAQRYGYFEIRARVPRGVGRWPAFWMTFAGRGWPPEIDVFEAYGAGLDRPGPRDGLFNTAVFFDAQDESGVRVHATPDVNPLAPDAESREARQRLRGGEPVFNFVRKIDSVALGADIYASVWTYAALWTPETVTFYFGKDRDSLQPIYQVPTPDDVHVPMYVIANDQFTTQDGWWEPRPEAIDRVTRPENDFLIEQITLLALPPDCRRAADTPLYGSAADCAVTYVDGTPGDDDLATGRGLEIVALAGGMDSVRIRRGPEMKILDGFGPDDRLVLEGFPFVDAEDARLRLTQVGKDVWLPSGADPFWPHTIVFRDTTPDRVAAARIEIVWPVGRDLWDADSLRSNAPEPAPEPGQPIVAGADGSWLSDRGAPRQMIGGPGGDRFILSHPRSTVEEAAGAGLDTLIADVSTVLPCHVERGIARRPGITLSSDCGARLEAEADGVALIPGGGDDLLVIAPGQRNVRLRLAEGGGHDRLRGLDPAAGHRLWLDDALTARRSAWRLSETVEGWRVAFDEAQSLLVEGADEATLRALLPMP
jgi:hypothetical protein